MAYTRHEPFGVVVSNRRIKAESQLLILDLGSDHALELPTGTLRVGLRLGLT